MKCQPNIYPDFEDASLAETIRQISPNVVRQSPLLRYFENVRSKKKCRTISQMYARNPQRLSKVVEDKKRDSLRKTLQSLLDIKTGRKHIKLKVQGINMANNQSGSVSSQNNMSHGRKYTQNRQKQSPRKRIRNLSVPQPITSNSQDSQKPDIFVTRFQKFREASRSTVLLSAANPNQESIDSKTNRYDQNAVQRKSMYESGEYHPQQYKKRRFHSVRFSSSVSQLSRHLSNSNSNIFQRIHGPRQKTKQVSSQAMECQPEILVNGENVKLSGIKGRRNKPFKHNKRRQPLKADESVVTTNRQKSGTLHYQQMKTYFQTKYGFLRPQTK